MMADTEEELRAKAMASMAFSSQPNSNSKFKKLQSKEEGEISPSPSEVDILARSAPDSADTLTREPSSSNLRSGQSGSLKSEHAVPATKVSKLFPTQARVPFKGTHCHKQMKHSSVRSRSHTWPIFSNDNLVITFSDDENGSDTDDTEPDLKKLRVESLGHNLVVKEFDKTQDKMLKKDALIDKTRRMHYKELTEKDSSIQTSYAEDASTSTIIEHPNHKMEITVNESNNQESANQRSTGGDSCVQHNVNNVTRPARFGRDVSVDILRPNGQVVRHSKFDEFSQRQSCNQETSFGQTNPRTFCKGKESLLPIIEEATFNPPHIGDKLGNHCRSVADIADAPDKLCKRAEEVNPPAGLNQGSSQKFFSSAMDAVNCQDRISNNKPETFLDGSILGHSKLLNWSSLELDSLLKLEEMQDKELEEAQDLRHRCEHEERIALKAYRKSQRALIDANNRCSLLYKKREVFSTKLREYIMKGSGISWSAGWMNNSENALDLSGSCPKAGHNLGLDNIHSLNADGFISNSRCQDSSHHNALNQHTSIEALPGQCFLPIACTSDPKYVTSGNASHTLHEPNLSKSNNEFCCPSCDTGTGQNVPSTLTSDVGNPGEKNVSVDVDSKKTSNEDIQDYELEAILRSKLVAKLSVKASEKCSQNAEASSADTNYAISASNNLEKNLSTQMQSGITNGQSAAMDYIDTGFQARASQAKDRHSSDGPCKPQHVTIDCVPSDVLRIVSRHVKFMIPKSSDLHQRSLDVNPCDSSIVALTDGNKMCLIGQPKLVMDLWTGDFVINPFWPLCMFELRGKCNDEECPWQHLWICGQKNQMHRKYYGPSDSEFSSDHHHNMVSIPSYQIGSVFIKDDKQFIGSLLSHSNWQYWHVSFCSFFRLPFSVERIFPSGGPMLHCGGVDHANVNDNSERKFIHFQNLDGATNQTFHGDVEKSLELALDLFNYTINKIVAKKKAMTVLSRSIEINPRSVVLWVVYLHIYYGKEGVIGEDDMFLQAVRHNESSYELWLMYINSRIQLENRMKAYDDALSALCSTEHISNLNIEYRSACILDIFLQMLDFLCMSGNLEKAIHIMHKLLDLPIGCKISDCVPWSNVASCLIVSDRCIFWICCVYVTIYKELPLVVVRQFELEKDLPFGIHWVPVQLTSSEKDRVVKLMKKALEILDLIEDSSGEKDLVQRSNFRPGHFLAVSHVRFIMAVEGSKGAIHLLDEYLRRYPTCLELVTLFVRWKRLMENDLGFEIFESALHNWPKHISGIQCLWNQYVEHALGCKSLDVAKKLMQRWFCCFYDGHDLQRKTELPPRSLDCPGFCYDEKDVTFGQLNLYLFKLLQKETIRAQLAINEALKQAPPDCFEHCVREHASFYLGSGVVPLIEIPCRSVLGLLNSYIGDVRTSRELCLLSRGFYREIKKPSIRNLIDNLLGPLSVDSSVLNSALEESYGVSLLPEFSEIKDLVDFVESLMELSPANYKLAISVRRKVDELLRKSDVASASLIFWANSLLVNSICKSFPPPPEHVWLEVADLLSSFEMQYINQRFHQLAVLAYPFSLKLWQSYFKLSKTSGNEKVVVEAARERGFEIC